MGCGLFLGAVAVYATDLHALSLPHWLVFHGLVVGPTVLQPWLQYKWYKIIARFLVGFASGTWLLGALGFGPKPELFSPLVWGVVSLLFFAALARALLMLRTRITKSPCSDCPKGAFPTCSWNLENGLVADGVLSEAMADIASRGSWATDIESVGEDGLKK